MCLLVGGGVPTCGGVVPLRGRGSGGISRHSVVSRHTGGDEGLVGTLGRDGVSRHSVVSRHIWVSRHTDFCLFSCLKWRAY